jgi:predicted DNA-binding transcriptional regulator AlpA
MSDIAVTQRKGRFGPPCGWFEHDIATWVRSRTCTATGKPALPPLPIPDTPRILRERDVARLTGLSREYRWKLEREG